MPNATTTLAYGSLGVCERLLNQTTQVIYRLATESGTMAMSRQRYKWLLSQIYGVLQEIFSGKTIEPGSEGCENVMLEPLSIRCLTQGSDNYDRVSGNRNTRRASARRPPAASSFGLVNAVSVEVKGARQRTCLTFLDYQPITPSAATASQPSGSFTQCRLYVETASTAPSAGCIFQVCELRGPRYQLLKTLSTCGVHSQDSPVFGHLRNGDTVAIKRMLSLRTISPNDRDEDGNTLLWVGLILSFLR